MPGYNIAVKCVQYFQHSAHLTRLRMILFVQYGASKGERGYDSDMRSRVQKPSSCIHIIDIYCVCPYAKNWKNIYAIRTFPRIVYIRIRILLGGGQLCKHAVWGIHRAYCALPRQNKISENLNESKVEMMISTVFKPVCFGHFILSP